MGGAFQTMLGGGDPGGGTRFVKLDTLNASLAVGQEGRLVGITTGALIGTFRKRAAGLELCGPLYLYQADGPELIGTIGLAAEGAAGALVWGAAGSRSTGGLQLPTGGTVGFAGLAPFRGWQCDILASVYLDTLEAVPDIGDAIWVGWRRTATTTITALALAYTGSIWASAGVLAGNRDTPTLTATTTYGAPAEDVEHLIGGTVYPATANSDQNIIVGGSKRPALQAPQQALSGAVNQSVDDRYPCFGLRGTTMIARVVEVNMQGVA